MTTTNTNPLLPRVKQMNVGEAITVSIDEYAYNTLRRYACDLGMYYQRKFSVRLDRNARTYTITRKS